ncbi:MAG: M48 family metalloprotease [Acidobacteria bacterium]|nr:M48 family metalloprotease [Acidobacteriota bacterium]MBI3280610.1 M48 family metalloprotease [Acidobacteriota bacterium]
MLLKFVVLLTAGAAAAQERPIGKGVNFYSREKEAALGAQLARETRERAKVIGNAVVQAYIEDIGRGLATQLPPDVFPCTFAIVEGNANSTHEPLSLPGGYIFVPASLVLAARDEAEFAGMLAHAMAHVAERHGTRQATRGQILNQASIPLILSSDRPGRQWPRQEVGRADRSLTIDRQAADPAPFR